MRGQIVTLFWRELQDMDEETHEAYLAEDAHLLRLASSRPGFVSSKSYVAEDGEHLIVIVFDSEAEQDAWRHDPEHLPAIRRGHTTYYRSFRSMVCRVERDKSWRVDDGPRGD